MSAGTSIQWTDATWSPLRARRRDTGKVGQHCERVSPGCTNCYAARHNGRNLPNGGTGLDYVRGSRDLVETFVDERVLVQPLKWREPKRVFVCNQTDLFADFYTDGQRDRVFAVMALAPQHTFQVLTKRPERMREYMAEGGWKRAPGGPLRDRIEVAALKLRHGQRDGFWGRTAEPQTASQWPMRNVWLGVTAEDQQRADERIPLLLDTPAAVRFLSVEPLLGPVDLNAIPHPLRHPKATFPVHLDALRVLDWVIVGGESGPRSRPCDVAWLRSIVEQCRAAHVAAFVKQLGARPFDSADEDGRCECPQWTERCEADDHPTGFLRLLDRKGGTMSEWPADLRVREFPEVRVG